MHWLAHFTQKALDCLYPRTCIFSREVLPSKSRFRYIADRLPSQLPFVRGATCSSCGYPFQGAIAAEDKNLTCKQCLKLKPLFREGKTLFIFEEPICTLIYELKYRDGHYLWPDVLCLLQNVPEIQTFLSGKTLVPVPLHPIKEWRRGFNQSLLLCQILKKWIPNVSIQNVLRRKRYTKTQVGLTREQRAQNVKNAFAISKKTVINETIQYCIVDDVFTTGATLNACAHTLRKAGARNVDIFTLAHG